MTKTTNVPDIIPKDPVQTVKIKTMIQRRLKKTIWVEYWRMMQKYSDFDKENNMNYENVKTEIIKKK